MNNAQLPTDYEHLISLGFSECNVRETLAVTRGDKKAALHILQRGLKDSDNSWRKEGKDDFVNDVANLNLPNSPEARALHKSPIYTRVGQVFLRDGVVYHKLTVVLLDRRSWSVEKTYYDFCSLKQSLPLGTCSMFTNRFPQPSILAVFGKQMNRAELETRRARLEEWLRELVLNEAAMTNTSILALIYEFVEESKHRASASASAAAALSPSTKHGLTGGVGAGAPTSPNLNLAAGSGSSPHPHTNTQQLQPPVLPGTLFPLPLAKFRERLPFKVNLAELKDPPQVHVAKEQEDPEAVMKQLTKDFKVFLSSLISLILFISLSPTQNLSLSLYISFFLFLSLPLSSFLYLSLPFSTSLYLSLPFSTSLYLSFFLSISLSFSLDIAGPDHYKLS